MPDRFLSIEECMAEIENTSDPTTKEVFRTFKEAMEGGDYVVMVNDDGPERKYYALVLGEPVRPLDSKKLP